MSSLSYNPKVAIVGRPNVGKSSLFNKLTRSRNAMVKDEPGVTRDLLMDTAEWWGKTFDVVDTGGLTDSEDEISTLIKKQVSAYLASVDMIVLVMDGRVGLTPEDQDVFRLVHATGKPFMTVINKIDNTVAPEMLLSDFYQLGVELTPVAFEKDFNIDKIVEWVISFSTDIIPAEEQGFLVSMVGKPNAGKSSLCNQLLGQDRMLVSTIAGTTVDSVESSFVYDDKLYTIMDTAGLRQPGKRASDLETLSTFKTRDSIEKSQLVLLVVDAQVGLSHQDARIVDFCLERHKALLLVVNKMDLARGIQSDYRSWFKEHLATKFHFYKNIPYVFISAKTGSGLKDLFESVENIREKMQTRISTSKLNKFFHEVIKKAPSPVWGANNVKFYYLTQTRQKPPSFIAFANQPKGVTPAYRRFLINQIQKEFNLEGIPIRIFVLPKGIRTRTRTTSDLSQEIDNPEVIEMSDLDLQDFDLQESELQEFMGAE